MGDSEGRLPQQGTDVTGLGGINNGTLTITGITKSIKRGLMVIRMYYKNDTLGIKYAQVRVGEQGPVAVAFLSTSFGAVASRLVTVNVTTIHTFKFLERTQELVIEGLGNANMNYRADIDLILAD